jgi:ribosomal 30S subunit maturation factor RimM
MYRFGIATAACLLALPGLALAQDGEAQEPLDVDALQEIEDMDVMNADGEEIGEIEEVLVDGSGRIVAVTVEIGGIMDIGDEELVLTLDNLTWREDGFVLDLTEDEMAALPRFD